MREWNAESFVVHNVQYTFSFLNRFGLLLTLFVLKGHVFSEQLTDVLVIMVLSEKYVYGHVQVPENATSPGFSSMLMRLNIFIKS